MSIATTPRTIVCNNRQDWLEARRSVIGASDSAAIFGVGYAESSALTVWDSKVNATDEPDEEPKRFRVGRLIEPALRAIFADETGLPCHSPGDHTIYVHPDIPWLGATLDGVCDELGGMVPVELKNVSGFNRDEWSDEPPLKYQIQVQQQLAVTGADHAYLFGLLGGNEPVVKRVERNERFISAMIDKLAEFWGYVERREMPPVDDSLATAKLLARLYPEDNGLTIALPDEAAEWVEQLAAAKADAKDAEAREVAAKNNLVAAMGEATFGLLADGRKVSLKTQHRAEYVCKASSFRVLRVCK